MNYFLSNLFRDWKWLAKLGFAFIGAMNVMDILSATFAYPGYFGLWIVRTTVIAGFSGLLAYYLYWNRRDARTRQVERLLPALAAERLAYFEKMMAVDPKFQTFCYKCLHYDGERRCCKLRLHGREVKVKLDPYGTQSYCLYWNLSDHPILALTERTFGEKTSKTDIR